MRGAIPDQCEWKFRKGFGQGSVPCEETLRYDGVDGVVHLVMWHSGRAKYVGPVCASRGRAGETLKEQFFAMYGQDWDKRLTAHVDSLEEQAATKRSQRRFEHALSWSPPPRAGGLVRADNSGVMEVGMGYIPAPPRIRKVG